MAATPRSRLTARPAPIAGRHAAAGTVRLADRGLLHVPPAAAAGTPSPLVVLLHGAGSTADRGVAPLAPHADASGLVLLAPQAARGTWDVVTGGFGPDVAAIDGALRTVFATVPVDPARVALGGFSDGASYALSLGIGNGDLFTHLVAFSPGFAAPEAPVGRPPVFVTHGVDDTVLPIDRCSRRLVPALRAAGHDVTYEEFPGGHVVPPELAARAVAWLTAPSPS